MDTKANLVDISTVTVNPNQTFEERLIDFERQVGNHKHFMCCGYEVTASFENEQLSFRKCMLIAMSQKI